MFTETRERGIRGGRWEVRIHGQMNETRAEEGESDQERKYENTNRERTEYSSVIITIRTAHQDTRSNLQWWVRVSVLSAVRYRRILPLRCPRVGSVSEYLFHCCDAPFVPFDVS